MRRLRLTLSALAVSAVLAAAIVSSAAAYGGGASHDMWQVGISFNCNSPTLCAGQTGGFWGWVEFDRAGSTTWGDAQLTGCGHTIGGGGPGLAGASHQSIEIESWTIEPGSAGPQTFYASGEETDFAPGGVKDTFDFSHMDTGIPAVPGHYSTSEILGFSAPGIAAQIQVAYRPAK
jgi:hypothetical protein